MGVSQKTPETTGSGLQRLLDAGEKAFSAQGFDGTSMKEISRTAEVSQSLLHYHFGTKEALYRAVIERRSEAINAERLRLLAKVDLSGADAQSGIFRALLGPPLGPIGGGMSYARIFAGLVAGGSREVDLVRELYDDTARCFIDALLTASPGISRIQATRGYSMAIGVLAISLSGDDRNASLAGTNPVRNREQMLPTLVTYACGGFAALEKQAKESND